MESTQSADLTCPEMAGIIRSLIPAELDSQLRVNLPLDSDRRDAAPACSQSHSREARFGSTAAPLWANSAHAWEQQRPDWVS